MTELDWKIRLFIYQFFVENERPPSFPETAEHFNIAAEEARQAYRRLNEAHTIFLDPGSDNIRMANPLSAVPTDYRVHVNGKHLWANCAWDSLGIPAMLKSDATIEATLRPSNEKIGYAIEHGALKADPGLLVHFALPFARWYENLIDT